MSESMIRLRSGDALEGSVLRQGAGEPLVLFHGVTGSASMWRRVVPLLSPYHDVIAPTALGHLGGSRAVIRPARIEHVIDDAERFIDALGFGQVHLAGNSMGGWAALELARRGRALSVCALSPAGAWGPSERRAAQTRLRVIAALTKSTRRLLPLLAGSPKFRRFALRDTAVNGDRVSPEQLVELADALIGCEIRDELLATDESLPPLEPSCPVLIAWSGRDRIFPVDVNGPIARSLVPAARFEVLEGVGHVPMLDDPALVAATIRKSVAAAKRPEFKQGRTGFAGE
jgi:pimeloyl-ACP methyl ester carboxylesterase